jgi:hypothetical protein
LHARIKGHDVVAGNRQNYEVLPGTPPVWLQTPFGGALKGAGTGWHRNAWHENNMIGTGIVLREEYMRE